MCICLTNLFLDCSNYMTALSQFNSIRTHPSKNAFYLLKLLCTITFKSTSIKHPFCSIVPCLNCSCNVSNSISRVLGLYVNNRLIYYPWQGQARTDKLIHNHVQHWSLGLQELFHSSLWKTATRTPPGHLCTCTGQGRDHWSNREKEIETAQLHLLFVFLSTNLVSLNNVFCLDWFHSNPNNFFVWK